MLFLLEEVSIFDNLNTFLHQAVELLSQILNGLRQVPAFISESGSQLLRYRDCFPAFIWFLITFAFGAGIIQKLLHWGD